ncbi:efflux RND transporter periplasmic adaptor subunit [Sinorhizobium meliloti]|uniref:efflux RND transporter periplasmic adaptor subunit n=1 Tax=Rhizobium meliloti TaxID=382 RepID=UPI003F15399C
MQPFRLILFCLACASLGGCQDKAATSVPPQQVRTVRVAAAEYQPEAAITGEVKARVQTDLSFRVSGRVVERRADVGTHVRAGDVLATLEDTEQRADVDVAEAALQSAQAMVRQKTLTFERYKTLLQSRAIAQAAYDQARQELVAAQSALESAEATLATAQDSLSYTELKADADGIITARTVEVGQVVSVAQSAFTLAHKGPRDAVFDVYEAFFLEGRPLSDVDVALVTDPERKAKASIREVSPAINTKAGTIRVKVALPEGASWPLGTPVVGQFRSSPREGLILPSSAIASAMGAPGVWVVDTAARSVSLRRVSVARYRTSDFIVTGGIAPQDLIVTEGGKFLKEGQAVAWEVK